MTHRFPSENNPLNAIRETPAWAPYVKEVKTLLDYWHKTQDMKIRVEMADDALQPFTLEFEYSHRWRDSYRLMTIAKLYALEKALHRSGSTVPVTMMTLTTYQGGPESVKAVGGYTIPKSFDVLAARGRALLNNIRQHVAPGLPYYWLTEPHQSGYPHRHYVLFGELTDDQMERTQALWTDKYGAGGRKAHRLPWESQAGGMFSIDRTQRPIENIRNYLMKYLTKNLSPATMTPGELVYHAVAKANRFRFWGASRDITAMMKREGSPAFGKWLKTDVISEWGDAISSRQSDVYEELRTLGRERLQNLGFGVTV